MKTEMQLNIGGRSLPSRKPFHVFSYILVHYFCPLTFFEACSVTQFPESSKLFRGIHASGSNEDIKQNKTRNIINSTQNLLKKKEKR